MCVNFTAYLGALSNLAGLKGGGLLTGVTICKARHTQEGPACGRCGSVTKHACVRACVCVCVVRACVHACMHAWMSKLPGADAPCWLWVLPGRATGQGLLGEDVRVRV